MSEIDTKLAQLETESLGTMLQLHMNVLKI